MFLTGSMLLPFLDPGSRGVAVNISATCDVELIGTSIWERMLADDNAEIAYFVEIEPWVLADRS